MQPPYVVNTEKLSLLNHFPWYSFWGKKIDYMEEWYAIKQEKLKNIYHLFNYFVGLGENALLYVKNTIEEEKPELCDRLSFQHIRVRHNNTDCEYYDPTTLIIDHSTRDLGEYIKSNIFNGTFDIKKLKECLDKYDVSRYWIRMLYGRIIFPSYFFDYIEKLMTDEKIKITKNNIEQKIRSMESALESISRLLREKYHIPTINWLAKKT
jgi:hypothetical protein